MIKILLIEDNQEVRENTAEILTLSNYKVLMADNGKAGVKLALEEKPDLIICDIMMPVLDGYGVLHLVGKNKETAGIPFIFLTAKADKNDFRKGMELGADDYLTKPFDDLDLLKAVEMRLKKVEFRKQGFTPDISGINDFFNEVKNTGEIQLTSGEKEVFNYKKHHELYTEGHRPTVVYFVVKGKIKTFKVSEDGKELITEIYGQGDFFGYTALLEEINYTDNAEVLEDSELMQIPKRDFLELISSNSKIAGQFIKLLSRNVLEKEEKLISLAYNSLRKRVANGLLQVVAKMDDKTPAIQMSRENLAQVIGTATESLIRTLSDFKSERLIDIKEGKIMILEKEKLKNLLF